MRRTAGILIAAGLALAATGTPGATGGEAVSAVAVPVAPGEVQHTVIETVFPAAANARRRDTRRFDLWFSALHVIGTTTSLGRRALLVAQDRGARSLVLDAATGYPLRMETQSTGRRRFDAITRTTTMQTLPIAGVELTIGRHPRARVVVYGNRGPGRATTDTPDAKIDGT